MPSDGDQGRSHFDTTVIARCRRESDARFDTVVLSAGINAIAVEFEIDAVISQVVYIAQVETFGTTGESGNGDGRRNGLQDTPRQIGQLQIKQYPKIVA